MEHEQDLNSLEGHVSEEELEALRTEATIMGDPDEVATAERLFRQNLPHAALAIVKISQNGQSERARLDASRYIVERVMGRLQDLNFAARDELMDLVKSLTDGGPDEEG
jgi:hypothetical protein